jgi:hypothetical protein
MCKTVDKIQNPFTGSFQTEDFSIKEYEQLTDIASDSVLKQKFPTISLSRSWASLTEEYPEILRCAVRKLLPFPTTCLCESVFSRYNMTKTNYRNKLDAQADLRLQLSPIIPDF